MATRQRTRVAALTNGLLVFGVPTALTLPAMFTDPQAWPADISVLAAFLEFLRFELTFAALGAVAGWRTLVDARRYASGQSRGWQGVAEAAVCGFVVAILYLAPGIVTRSHEAPP